MKAATMPTRRAADGPGGELASAALIPMPLFDALAGEVVGLPVTDEESDEECTTPPVAVPDAVEDTEAG